MRTIVIFVCFFLIVSFPVCAEGHPDYEPLFTFEHLFQDSQVPESCSADEVFIMGLMFSECIKDSERWNDCIRKFEIIKKDVNSKEMQKLTDEERGRAVLKYLYGGTLKKYSLNQTKLDEALETGLYNCVSSAVLYLAAAKAAGLNVRGQHTNQHAFCSIYINAGNQKQLKKIDVETTNPYGFNPGSKEEIENENKIKQYYVVPKKYYASRQEVSDGVFTGLIAGNLCSEYIKNGDYHKAVPLGAARYEAVRNESSKIIKEVRNSFDILPCNYINIYSESAEEYSSRLEWFTGFIARWGIDDFLQKNMDNCFNNHFVLCKKEKNYSLAEKYYSQLGPYVSKKQLDKSAESLADIFIMLKTEDQSPEEQIFTVCQIRESDKADAALQKTADLYLENAWINVLNDHMKREDYLEGYLKSLKAEAQLPLSRRIKKMKNIFYSNYIAVVHNNFASEANRNNFEAAEDVLKKGLEIFPDDKNLLRDLSNLKKNENRSAF